MTTIEEISNLNEEEQRYTELEEFARANNLEEEFINSFPPEEQPLDDEQADFIHNYAEEYENFVLEEFQAYCNNFGISD